MANNMGEIIRKLRKERDLTQEELAEQFGVTSQAVSKWENNTGMPDISQVVPLANFFGVSTDTLFDYCSEDKKREIEEYEKCALQLNNKGMIPELVELWREALGKYPGNYLCMSNLAYALFGYSGDGSKSEIESYAKEGVELCERILSGCTELMFRENAIQLLTFWYGNPMYSFADEEKAVSYAEMGGDMNCSSQMLLEHVYRTPESYEKHRAICDQNILSFIDSVTRTLTFRSEDKYEDKIRNCQLALSLWKKLIPDGNYLFYHCHINIIYEHLAYCYANLSDKNKTIDALRHAIYHSKVFDSGSDEEQNFTSPFVCYAVSVTVPGLRNYTGTEYEQILEWIKKPCFDFLRDDPEFIALFE